LETFDIVNVCRFVPVKRFAGSDRLVSLTATKTHGSAEEPLWSSQGKFRCIFWLESASIGHVKTTKPQGNRREFQERKANHSENKNEIYPVILLYTINSVILYRV
jgi:hypothetical protein